MISCELQDIKEKSITAKELDELAKLAGSYEALFSRNAIKYRSMGLNTKKLIEKDYRELILSEYTFLKRPVIKIGNKIFIGHTKAAIEGAQILLSKKKAIGWRNERMKEWMKEWMNERKNEGKNEGMKERKKERMNEWINESRNEKEMNYEVMNNSSLKGLNSNSHGWNPW